MQIVNLFYELARQHKQINGFIYGKGYEKGTAHEVHPLIWLDDPVYGLMVENTLQYTVNIDILGIPENNKEVLEIQTAAFNVGLTLKEKINREQINTGFKVNAFDFVTLRDYYDNNAAGCRFTYTLIQANPLDRCADDFDPDKEFPKVDALRDFTIDNPEGCAIFSNKKGLPNFKIDIK